MSSKIFLFYYLISILFVEYASCCISTVRAPAKELPHISRPKLDYTKVTFNCVDKAVRKSSNEIRRFYSNINLRFKNFLEYTKKNDFDLEMYSEKTEKLRIEYIEFRDHSKLFPCQGNSSWKNLMEMLDSIIDILGFFSDVDLQQYLGNISFI